MNWKKFWIAFVVIYVVGFAYNFVVHNLLLGDTYQALSSIWRPDMNSLMWVQFVTAFFICFFMIYIFARGYEGKGLMEGVRFGLVMFGFVSVPSIYGQYMVYPLPYSLVWKWLPADLIIWVLSGVLVALIYKPAEKKS